MIVNTSRRTTAGLSPALRAHGGVVDFSHQSIGFDLGDLAVGHAQVGDGEAVIFQAARAQEERDIDANLVSRRRRGETKDHRVMRRQRCVMTHLFRQVRANKLDALSTVFIALHRAHIGHAAIVRHANDVNTLSNA